MEYQLYESYEGLKYNNIPTTVEGGKKKRSSEPSLDSTTIMEHCDLLSINSLVFFTLRLQNSILEPRNDPSMYRNTFMQSKFFGKTEVCNSWLNSLLNS